MTDINIDTSMINTMSTRSFIRHINSASNIPPIFIKCTFGFPSKTKYIMLALDKIVKFHKNTLKVSNSKVILPNNFDMRLRNRVVSEQPLHHNNSVVTPPPEKTTISTVAVEDCRETDAD